MDNTDKDLLTVKEFAEAAGVSRQRIYKLMVDSLQPYTVKQENGYTLLKAEGLKLFGKAVELKPCNPTELKPCNSKNAVELTAFNSTQNSSNKGIEPNLVDSVQPDRVDSVQPYGVETLQQQNAERVDSVQQQINNDYVRIPAKTLEMLQQQLTEKDKQISLLLSTNAEQLQSIRDLTAALTAEQLQSNNLTAALNAAQALHAGTIQERLSTGAGQSFDQESPADQTEEQESRAGDQTEEQDPPPKRGLISRLFSRIRRV